MKSASTQTTAQSLGALLKSARDIMRKDKDLNGDLDRLPMLTWIMFLKFLDDLELQREGEAKLAGKKFKPAIEPPYRWRDWAAQSGGITGDELLAFINQEECTLPNGKKGAGLFRYYREKAKAPEAGIKDWNHRKVGVSGAAATPPSGAFPQA
jgi:type I restriction enzyme M protein